MPGVVLFLVVNLYSSGFLHCVVVKCSEVQEKPSASIFGMSEFFQMVAEVTRKKETSRSCKAV